MQDTPERRCNDCGAPVTDEHIALAAETGQAPYCVECWGEDIVTVSGAALDDLKQWAAYVDSQRPPYGEEPTVRCDFCNKLLEAADAAHSIYNGQPLCGGCKDQEEALIYAG